MKNFINETQEIKSAKFRNRMLGRERYQDVLSERLSTSEEVESLGRERYQEAVKMLGRTEIGQREAVLLQQSYSQDDNSINLYKSVFKKIKSGIPVQKAIDELLLEKGLSSESDSFQNLDSAVVSNKDNLQDKATISATADSILLLFREKKTDKMGVLRIYGNGTYELFNFEGLPVHPADQIVYSTPPVVQPVSTPAAAAPVSTPAPAPSKNITPYVYAGIGLIVIFLIARMVTK